MQYVSENNLQISLNTTNYRPYLTKGWSENLVTMKDVDPEVIRTAVKY